jgi:7-cyano-7-deazaguanine synthase
MDSALRPDLFGVFFQYGQHHEHREHQAANDIALHYGIPLEVIHLPVLGGSDLTTGSVKFDTTLAQYAHEIAPTFVPCRNTIMIAHAMQFAQAHRVPIVVGGWHGADVGYPDCSFAFIRAMESVLQIGQANEHLRIIAPLIRMTKLEIVYEASRLRVPVEKTYSCYVGKDQSCGRCGTCVQRIAAFKGAGLIDPIEYEVDIDWAGCLPFHP